MAATGWKRARRAVRAAVIVAFVRALMTMPLGVALALGGALGRLAWAISPRMRRDIRASLAVAFPERSDAERDAIARASLVHLGWVGAEAITMRRWADRLDAYVDAPPEAIATVERAWARKKGIIFVLGHIGNWELTSRLSRYVQPNAAIAKRSWHVRLDRLSERFRAENGVGTYWRDDPATGRAMLRLFRQGGALGILIDQDIRDVQSVFVPFFGRPAATPRAAADLALRFGAAVLVVTCHRRGPRAGDGHRLEVVEVPYDAAAPDREGEVVRLTAACAAVQEDAIRRHPAEWVWMHQRWKSRPDR
ncbi:lysophospholipid acyltransferase family protein [Anaeromyxobacter oryzae]|uniref:Lipid A biosynthesis lauroyl acyltransferase n=1 Tax=Anaeromyxobacter oryzae TaxID=2918170 RepID=A0ABM7WYW3_9BACT|nr:lipid A biosynthesis acyltransferase [Anaeromyxobacter oryzae]BDG04722.1 lipid A biosynthesis lauroyl acyltransferase [Anaeromyxobacter oryzae]